MKCMDPSVEDSVESGKISTSLSFGYSSCRRHLNVLLADHHLLLRNSIIPILEELAEEVQITEAATLGETLAACFSGSDIDLILLDRFMSGMRGMTGLQWLRRRVPDTPIVILAPCESGSDARRAFAAGASGYVSTVSSPAVLWSALHLVLSGDRYLPPFILDLPNAETTAEFNAANTPTDLASFAAGVIVLDHQGNITDWCIGAEEMFGYSRREVLGKHIGLLYDTHDPNWPGVDFGAWTNTTRLHIPQAVFVRRDGTQGLCEIRVSAVLDSIGEPTALMVANRHLSDFGGVEAVGRYDHDRAAAATAVMTPGPADATMGPPLPSAATPPNEEAGDIDLPRLTARQHDVLALLSQGLSNKNIAKSLHIREPTVKIHVHSILLALHATNRTEAIVIAASRGLSSPAPR